MILKNHKKILKFIIKEWKIGAGQRVDLDNNRPLYKKLTNQLKIDLGPLNEKLDYLEQFKYIAKLPQTDKDQRLYVPTPEGLEYNKWWFFRETNYKWYIAVLCTVLGALLGVLITA